MESQFNDAPKSIAFQVTIKEADGISPFKPIENKEPLSEHDIKRKLEMAEERRLSLKSQIQEQAASELKRVQEKAAKMQEETLIKKKKMEEELAADLEAKEQNRLHLLEEKKAKLSNRFLANSKKVEEMNDVLGRARAQLSERIAAELDLAEDRRNKQLEALQDRIKEHDLKIEEARKNIEEAQAQQEAELEEKVMDKLESGIKNKQEQLNQILERLKEHSIHVEKVRQNRKAQEDIEENLQ